MQPLDTVIIGGGLGGLTCAAALARKGRRILLVEKNPVLGGAQATYKRGGFVIEPCLHVMVEAGPTGALARLLEGLGLGESVAFSRFSPTSQFVFPDRTVTVPAEGKGYLEALKGLFPGEAAGIEGAFDRMLRIARGLGEAPATDPMVARYGGKVFRDLLDEFAGDVRLRALLAGYGTYFGLPPSRISSLLVAAFTASIVFGGGYLPAGGIQRLVDSLEQAIVERGGEIRKKAPVKAVSVRGGRASGVILEGGEEIPAKAVVSNADARTTFFSLVGEEHLPGPFVERLRAIRPMCSSFNVFLGVKAEGLGLEAMAPALCCLPNYDLDGQYEAMRRGEIEANNFWIGLPTLTNPFMAPEGHHLVVLYATVPYRPAGIDWKEDKEAFTRRVIDLAEKAIPGLKRNIVMTDAASPDTLVRYTGNSEGAVAGWECSPEADALRPANRTPVEGLFLAGHWTVPGPGTGSVMQSGLIAADLIP